MPPDRSSLQQFCNGERAQACSKIALREDRLYDFFVLLGLEGARRVEETAAGPKPSESSSENFLSAARPGARTRMAAGGDESRDCVPAFRCRCRARRRGSDRSFPRLREVARRLLRACESRERAARFRAAGALSADASALMSVASNSAVGCRCASDGRLSSGRGAGIPDALGRGMTRCGEFRDEARSIVDEIRVDFFRSLIAHEQLAACGFMLIVFADRGSRFPAVEASPSAPPSTPDVRAGSPSRR